jgi:hypothetical protein
MPVSLMIYSIAGEYLCTIDDICSNESRGNGLSQKHVEEIQGILDFLLPRIDVLVESSLSEPRKLTESLGLLPKR